MQIKKERCLTKLQKKRLTISSFIKLNSISVTTSVHQNNKTAYKGKVCGQPTVRKKIAAVHFTTMPCEPNKAYKAHRKPHFSNIFPYTKEIE